MGVDAKNLYGFASSCVDSTCPFTVYGVSRAGGGTPFVAYQSPTAYWTASPPQVDETGLFWVDWSTRGICHAAMTLGAPAEIAAQLLAPGAEGTVPATFAMDACNLYWLTADATPSWRPRSRWTRLGIGIAHPPPSFDPGIRRLVAALSMPARRVTAVLNHRACCTRCYAPTVKMSRGT
jgi:hypothetical protein